MKILKKSINKIYRFLIAGFFNTIFGFTIFCIGYKSGLYIWLALIIAQLCGVIFNFITLGHAFKNLLLSNFPRFILAYFVLIIINIIIIDVLKKFIENLIILQGIISFPLAILSYLVMSNFVFKKSSI